MFFVFLSAFQVNRVKCVVDSPVEQQMMKKMQKKSLASPKGVMSAVALEADELASPSNTKGNPATEGL